MPKMGRERMRHSGDRLLHLSSPFYAPRTEAHCAYLYGAYRTIPLLPVFPPPLFLIGKGGMEEWEEVDCLLQGNGCRYKLRSAGEDW